MPAKLKPWKKLLLLNRSLHIYLSMLALLLLMFFALTGFIMNHPDWFGVDAVTTLDSTADIPVQIMHPSPDGPPDAPALIAFLQSRGIKGDVDSRGLSDDPATLSIKGPHYEYDLSISRTDGKATITKTTHTLMGLMARLHKGENTGTSWKWIIDVTSILLALISITGLFLWMTLAKRRTLGVISLALCIIAGLGIFIFLVP